MSKALDRVHELLKQKFPDANNVYVQVGPWGMETTVKFKTGEDNRTTIVQKEDN